MIYFSKQRYTTFASKHSFDIERMFLILTIKKQSYESNINCVSVSKWKSIAGKQSNHQIAPEVMGFLVQKAIESGNIVFGYSTYTMFIDALQDALAGKEIVVLSNNHEARSGHKTVHTPEEAVEYLKGKGMEEIVVGGGVQTYNAFLDKDLVTDIYFNVTPMVIGDGGVIGSKDDLFVKFDKMNYEPIIENVIRLHLSK